MRLKVIHLKSFLFMSCLVLINPLYADDDNGSEINISANNLKVIPVNHPDARLTDLRKNIDSKRLNEAKAKDKSFIATAPDPDNPEYWKMKNIEVSANDTKQEANSIVTQQLESQKIALEKVLADLNNDKSTATFTSIVFKSLNETPDLQSKHPVNTQPYLHKHKSSLPGTIWYATTQIGADSYIPSPVSVQLQEGPYAGGIALGDFTPAPDGSHLVLKFSSITYKGKLIHVAAIAVDPDERIGGVHGEIDHHFMTRYILPGAANFLTKITTALMNQSQDIVATPAGIISANRQLNKTQMALTGASGAAETFAQASKPEGVLSLPEVKISAGSGIGFLILEVVDPGEL